MFLLTYEMAAKVLGVDKRIKEKERKQTEKGVNFLVLLTQIKIFRLGVAPAVRSGCGGSSGSSPFWAAATADEDDYGHMNYYKNYCGDCVPVLHAGINLCERAFRINIPVPLSKGNVCLEGPLRVYIAHARAIQ